MPKRSLYLSIIMLYVAAAALAVMAFMAPSLIDWYVRIAGRTETYFYVFLAVFYGCCPFLFCILGLLHQVLRNLKKGNVFIPQNIRFLRYISWLCFCTVPLILLGSWFFPVMVLMAIVVAFMGLIVRVVNNVMAAACALKSENDLTI